MLTERSDEQEEEGRALAEPPEPGPAMGSEEHPAGQRSPEFYGAIGSKGGTATRRRYGSAHFAAIGRRGGKRTAERHGRDFYQEIGARGGQRIRELVARGRTEDAS